LRAEDVFRAAPRAGIVTPGHLGNHLPLRVVGECVTGTTTTPTLTTLDRCDRCGAQAYVRVVLPGGGDLLFCRHHAKSHDTQLRALAVEYHDETDRLEGANSN
jgi:hypothetical protein